MRRPFVSLAVALPLLFILALVPGAAFASGEYPVPSSAGASETTVDVLKGEMILTHVDYRDAEKLRNLREEMRKAQEMLDFILSDPVQDRKDDLFIEINDATNLVSLQIHDDGVHTESPESRLARATEEMKAISEATDAEIKKINDVQAAIEEELKKPIKENVNLNPKFTTKVVLENENLQLLRVGSDSIAQIKSDTKSVIIGPDSDVFIIVDKTADPQVFAGVEEGSLKINAKGSSLVVVENAVVMSLKTVYEVTRRGNQTTVSVHEGEVVVVHFTGGNATLTELKAGREAVLDDGKKVAQESFSDVERPLEVLSVKPQGTVSYNKPAVEVLFNIPVNQSSVGDDSIIMRSGGVLIGGTVSLDSDEKLFFIPDSPLGPGVYEITVSGGLGSAYGTTLAAPVSHNITVSSCPVVRGQEYILSGPRVFSMSEATVVTNTGTGKATGIHVQRPLAVNSSNVFARIDSIEPEPSSIAADGEGNTVVEWKITALDPGKSRTFTVNYTIMSFDIDYFSAIDAASVKPANGIGISDLPYIRSGKDIESANEMIIALGSEIAGGETNPYLVAQKDYGWISSNIRYDYSLEQDGGALETLIARKGVCHGYAALYAALLRSRGIPAKYVSGWGLTEGQNSDAHAWVEVLLPGYGWVPSDPTWSSGSYEYFSQMDAIHVPMSKMRGAETAGGSEYSGTTTVDFNSTAWKSELAPGNLNDPQLEKLYYAILLTGIDRRLPYTANADCTHSEVQVLLQQWLELRSDGRQDPAILEEACRDSAFSVIHNLNGSLGAIKEWDRTHDVASPGDIQDVLNNPDWEGSSGPSGVASFNMTYTITNAAGSEELIGRLESILKKDWKDGYNCEDVALEIEPVYDDLQNVLMWMSVSSSSDAPPTYRTDELFTGVYPFNLDGFTSDYLGLDGAQALVVIGVVLLVLLVLFLIWLASMLHCIMRKDIGTGKKLLWLAVIVILNLLGTLLYFLLGRKKGEKVKKKPKAR